MTLKLECMAIGSLPYTDLDRAMTLVKENFGTIPFWPQMSKISKNEDMIIQFLENMPSFFLADDSVCLETESDEFFSDLENFVCDYEEIIAGNLEALDKYAITSSLSFNSFLEIVEDLKPPFAKGQIVGPFTLSTTLVDKHGKCAIYDDTLCEIIVKTLTLKALWQIKKIKSASPGTTPIIFIDEPSISQSGTSAFMTIPQTKVLAMIDEISNVIKENGGISAIHCCGKCDWGLLMRSTVDIINFDAYCFAQNLSLFADDLKRYFNSGRKIAWGVIPTLDKAALEHADLDEMVVVFENAVKYLTKKGLDEKIIIENSLITPSCGAGGLNEELADKAMNLTKQLSDILKERFI